MNSRYIPARIGCRRAATIYRAAFPTIRCKTVNGSLHILSAISTFRKRLRSGILLPFRRAGSYRDTTIRIIPTSTILSLVTRPTFPTTIHAAFTVVRFPFPNCGERCISSLMAYRPALFCILTTAMWDIRKAVICRRNLILRILSYRARTLSR